MFFHFDLLSFVLTARNRREVPCEVKFRLARCDNLIIKERNIMTIASAIFGSVVAICIASVICKFLDEWFLCNDKK